MVKFIRTIGVGVLLSMVSGVALAFWFGESYVPIPPQRTSQTPSLNTDTVFVLTADSFVDDQGQPTKVQGASFSHGDGVCTNQIKTFWQILQANPGLSSTILIVTDGQSPPDIYDANGLVTDPSKISPDSKRLVVFLADIPGEKEEDIIDEKTGKKTGGKQWGFDAGLAHKTISDTLVALSKTNAPVVVNLSLSSKTPYKNLEDLLRTYNNNVVFVASANGYPGKYNLPNVIPVGNASASREGLPSDTVYAEGRVQVPNQQTGEVESAYGASFAVPQAVIAAALAWQQNGNLTSADVKNIIIGPTLVATADSPATGELNPQASLDMAKSYTSPSIGRVSVIDPFSSFGFIW